MCTCKVGFCLLHRSFQLAICNYGQGLITCRPVGVPVSHPTLGTKLIGKSVIFLAILLKIPYSYTI